jgi:hypothetical protein
MESQPSDGLTNQVTAAYANAEATILTRASRILQRASATFAGRTRAFAQLRRLVGTLITQLAPYDLVAGNAITQAAIEGGSAARAQLALPQGESGPGGGIPTPPPGFGLTPEQPPFDLSMPHGERAAQAIRDDVVSSLEDVRRRITRLPDDIFKAIAPHGAIGQVLDNEITPAQAQAAAWRVFTQNGVTGFVDRAGRNWSMSAYVEMAVRTASARAFNDSHMQTMRAVGIKYFTVPSHGSTCPLCYPWQGAVLTDAANPDPTVATDGTIDEAVAAGLFHPNCRHTLAPYFPGITDLHQQPPWSDEQQAEYEDSQRQRALERDIRRAKQQAQTAITPEQRAIAVADVRKAQARMRAFIAASGRLRQSRREQVHLAMDHIKMPHVPSGGQPRL